MYGEETAGGGALPEGAVHPQSAPVPPNPRRHTTSVGAGRLVGELMKRISPQIDFKAFADGASRQPTEKKLV